MNKASKITFLLVAMLMAIGAIVFYVKTIASPPDELSFSNQYSKELKEDIGKVKGNITAQQLDSLYSTITDALSYQLKEQLISSADRDALLDKFVSSYIPLFLKNSNRMFGLTEWNEDELRKMKKRVIELKTLRLSDGNKPVLEGNVVDSINRISKNVDLYFIAKKFAYKRYRYNGINNVQTVIQQAKTYAQTAPLSNCLSLVGKLNSVGTQIENSHFKHLVTLVKDVEYYYSWDKYDEASYSNFANEVYSEIEAYKNKTPFYTNHHNTKNLSRRRTAAVKEAHYYYFTSEQ